VAHLAVRGAVVRRRAKLEGWKEGKLATLAAFQPSNLGGVVVVLLLRTDPAVFQVLVQHVDAVAPMATRGAVGYDQALLLDLAQGEQADPEVARCLFRSQ